MYSASSAAGELSALVAAAKSRVEAGLQLQPVEGPNSTSPEPQLVKAWPAGDETLDLQPTSARPAAAKRQALALMVHRLQHDVGEVGAGIGVALAAGGED